MASTTKTPKPASAISLTAARVSLAATITSAALLTILHFLKPDLDPSWRVISEYAIGDFGWMMIAAFLALAVSCVALFVAIKSQIRNVYGWIGLGLLLLTGLGMAIAGIFVTDPITTSADSFSTAGTLHQIGAYLDMTPFAAILVSLSLFRKNPSWAPAKKALKLTMLVPLVGLIVFTGAAATMVPADGSFGPEVMIGWPNRFLMFTYYVWFAVAALQAIKLRQNA